MFASVLVLHRRAGIGGIDAVRDPVPDLFKAVEAQLGLKLEPKKTPGSVLVIQRYNRTPSAN